MQRRAVAAGLVVAVISAVATGGAALVTSSATSARALAASWLRAHRTWQPDELAELKGVNPEAYAIVKALLTKRSLGLLDPRHPSASFAPAVPAASDGAPSGAAAFTNLAEEADKKPQAALIYPDAPVVQVHHDWLSWKPQQSAVDDEGLVQNVLGQVAALKEGTPVTKPHTEELAQASEDTHQGVDSTNDQADGGKAVADFASASQGFSRWFASRGGADAAASAATSDSGKSASSASASGGAVGSSQEQGQAGGPSGTLFAWLSGGKPKRAAAPPPVPEQKPTNSYLSDLQ